MKLTFGLRTLFFAILSLSVVLGLAAPLLHRWRREQRVVAEVERRGGNVYYHHEMSPSSNPAMTPPGPAWLRAIFGQNCFARVHSVWLQHWDVPAWKHPPLQDDDLKLLLPLSDLRSLMLDGSKVSDEGLVHLKQHPLTELHLSGTEITDSGVRHLSKIETLERLNLSGTKITDASLEHLRKMPNLKRIHVGATKVRRESVDEFNRGNSRQLVLDGREFSQ